MSNTTIQIKKSATPSAVPSNLANGELAINYADGKLYYKAANGTIAAISGAGGEPSFGTVNVGGTLVVADQTGDVLTLIAGSNITLSADTINDTVTISSTASGGNGSTDYSPAFDRANLALATAQSAFTEANSSVQYTTGGTYTAGAKQSFTPNTTLAGINLGSLAGNPSSAINGDVVFNSSSNRFTGYISGWRTFVQYELSGVFTGALTYTGTQTMNAATTFNANASFNIATFSAKSQFANGFNIVGRAGDSLGVSNGDVWFNSTSGKLSWRQNDINYTFASNADIALIASSTNSYTNSVGTSGNAYALSTATEVGTAGNAYATIVGTSGNSYALSIATAVGVSGNSYTTSVGSSGNAYSLATATSIGTSGNAYATLVGSSANARANVVGTSSNAYALSIATSIGTAGNVYAASVGVGANSYATSVGASSNGYATLIGASANGWANTKVSSSGGTITGDLSITGNLFVSGNVTSTSANNIVVEDSFIILANNNVGDILDIGFAAHYDNATGNSVHTGFFRSPGTKEWYLFKNYDKHFFYNGGNIDLTGNNFTIDTLNSNLRTSNLVLNGANAQLFIVSAYAQANAAPSIANSYAVIVGNSANARANVVGTSGNAYATSVGTSGNAYALSIATSVGTSGNVYATSVGVGANAYSLTIATSIGTSGNAYAASVGVGANSYATSVGTSANARSSAIGTSGNAYALATATSIGTSGNAYATAVGAAGNTYTLAAFNKANSTSYTSNVTIVVADNSNAALRITQTGTSDAIRVEDEANPDSSPFIVTGTGNVGIGITTPSSKLEVLGAAVNTIANLGNGDGATVTITNSDVSGLGRISKTLYEVGNLPLASVAGVYTNFNGSNDIGGALALGTQTNAAGGVVERMRIDANGNVGIGTTLPSDKLQVAATDASVDFSGRVDSATAGHRPSFRFLHTGGSLTTPSPTDARLGLVSFLGVSSVGTLSTYAYFDSFLEGAPTSGSESSYIKFLTTSSGALEERFRIHSNGNIGIGTSAPAYKLDVNGTINAAAVLVNGAPISGGAGGAYYSGNNGDVGEASGLGDIFRVHTNTLTANVTIYSGNNSIAAGPLTVALGKTLTVQANARVVIA